jgi:hypothetical protein
MNAKQRRIWRRREARRNGHSVRCAQFRGGSCDCTAVEMRKEGLAAAADKVAGTRLY